MKKVILFITLSALVVSCSETKEETNKTEAPALEAPPIIQMEEDLTEVKDNIFTEYYPGKKAVKFRGEQDKEGRRNGVWLYYSENGEELSMTNYEHGVKNGHTMVKYPNGAIHYTGEYTNDQPSGVWKTYDAMGKLTSTKDYSKSN